MIHSVHCSRIGFEALTVSAKSVQLEIRGDPLVAKVHSTQEAANQLCQPSIHQTSTVLDFPSWGSWQNHDAGLMWLLLSTVSEQSVDWALAVRWVCGLKGKVFSVIDSQPKNLQQLLVVWVDEVSRRLAAVILQLRVSTQREKVAERKQYNTT